MQKLNEVLRLRFELGLGEAVAFGKSLAGFQQDM
jgi:hypothetical protein